MSGTTWGTARRGSNGLVAAVGRLRNSLFARQLLSTSAVRFIGIAFSFLFSVMTSRILGPEGRGAFAAATTLAAVGVQFGNLGLHSANTYFVARDRRNLPAALGNSLLVGMGLASLGGVVAWVLFLQYPRLAPVHGMLCILGLAAIPLALTRLLGQNLLIAIQKVAVYNRLELAGNVLSVIMVAFLLAAFRVTPELMMGGTVVLSAIMLYATFRSIRPHLETAPVISFELLRVSSRYGIKAWAAALCSFLVIRSDILMVKTLAGDEACGFYSIAAAGADFLMTVPVLMGTLLFPRLAAIDDGPQRWRMAWRFVLMTVPSMLAAGTLLFFVAEPLIRLTYGSSFVPAAAAFRWLLPGLVALAANTVLMNYLAARAMPLVTVVSPGLALIANMSLNVVLIPEWGIRGAALSSTICYSLMLLISLVYIRFVDRSGSA